jgi:hypothetical protein
LKNIGVEDRGEFYDKVGASKRYGTKSYYADYKLFYLWMYSV